MRHFGPLFLSPSYNVLQRLTPYNNIMAENKFICPICDTQNLNKIFAVQHLALCIYNSSKAAGTELFCTCPGCQGKRTHPKSEEKSSKSSSSSSSSNTPANSSNNNNTDNNNVDTTCQRNPDQLCEMSCFFCDQRKEKKIPRHTQIGRFREIKFCKKGKIKVT